MIILFKDSEILFRGIGLGILRDAKVCTVEEGLNDTFEVKLEYPITGNLYDKLQLNRIIFCKPNPYSEAQPYRIASISKPINGIVTVNAFHISYDMNGLPVKPVDGKTCKDTLDKIQNGALITHHFKLYTDKEETKGFKTTNYFNMRALLMGSSDSVLEKYEGEMLFDKFNVYLLKKRGSNKGAQVRYAKNLKDITHEITYDRLYNGVYPYYHQETTSQTTTTSSDGFKQVYIVGSKPYQDGWLSYEENGNPYHPIDESPVQVATEGNFYQKVYCWNTTTQRYIEKIYNETVTLIDQVGNLLSSDATPSWIYIDWSKLPTITCKANTDGYFKPMTEQDWTYHKKGDIIFESSIKDAATNLIIYFSEVVPTTSTAETEETTEVTHVEIPDKIIKLDTDAAREMSFDRILTLDLSSEFDETPTPEQLEAKANEYIEKNKIGQYKYNTTVSFVDLSATTEGATYENMEKIELGDTVKVVYEGLGVNVDLRVIKTTYDVLLDRYSKIELGESSEKISGESIQNGDNVSSLINDVGFADVNTVNKLIAKTVTADFIKALNAQFSKAQIEELQTARLKVSGLLEASQMEIDHLVAKLLTADNAVIKETLEAGTVKVKGDISVMSGEITLENKDKETAFRVDRDGNVTANAVKITGGELNINDAFTVTPDGILTAQGAILSGTMYIEKGTIELGTKFKVEEDGTVTASGATIAGKITADEGSIAGFTISKVRVSGVDIGRIQNGVTSIDDTSHNGVYIGTDGIRLGPKFKVDAQGNVTAADVKWEVSRTVSYVSDSQGQIPPGSGWTTNIPTVPQGYYLWIREDILYIDNTHAYVYSSTRQGEDGTSVEISGSVATYTALLAVTGMTAGDGYIVDDASDDTSIPAGKPTDGILYIYNNNVWNYSGQIKGPQGDPGLTPEIDANGDWSIGGQSTGVHAQGPEGDTPYIGQNGNWWIGNTDTQVEAQGPQGNTPYIQDGYWYINGSSTGIQATGDPGDSPEVGQDGYWYVGGVSTGVKAQGDPGDTPYIQDGYWYISGQSTGVKAEGSDADVTWTNILQAFNIAGSDAKGIVYGTDAQGNAALLINATAGNIGGFTIYANNLHAGTSGSRVLVAPSYNKTLFGVNKDWSFLAGVTYTESGGVETYTGARFGVAKDGHVYATALHLSGGEIDISPYAGSDAYILDDISQLDVIYTVLYYQGSESTEYSGSTHDFDPYNLRQLPLPVAINGLAAGTMVPVVDNIYDGDYYTIDKYWYVGTMTFDGVEYDKWLHVEEPNYGGEGWDSDYQRYFLTTKAVRNISGFHVDAQGNVTASSVTILGGTLNIASQVASFNVTAEGVLEAAGAILSGTIYAGAGQIGGFTIGKEAIYSGFTDTSDKAQRRGVYIGNDIIMLGNDISRTYYYPSSSSYFTVPATLTNATSVFINDLNHPNDSYNGCRFKLTYTASSAYDRKIRFWPCDSGGTIDLTAEVCEAIIPKGSTEIFIVLKHPNPQLVNGQYMSICFKVYDEYAIGINNCRLTLDILPGFVVDSDGHLTASSVTLYGRIYATSGEIAGFKIDSEKILKGTIGQSNSVMVSTGTSATISNLVSGAKTWCFTASNNFGVTLAGEIYAMSGKIGKFTIGSNYISTGPTTPGGLGTKGLFLGEYGINFVPSYVSSNNYMQMKITTAGLTIDDNNTLFSRSVFVGSDELKYRITDLYDSSSYSSLHLSFTDPDFGSLIGPHITHGGSGVFQLFSMHGKLSGTWYGTSNQAITSDRNAKNHIEDLPEIYSVLFDKLKAVRFKYNDGTSGRYHTGFIAQDIEDALKESNIPTSDFASLIKNEDGYAVRYAELHALEVNEIQKLKKRVKELEDLLKNK